MEKKPKYKSLNIDGSKYRTHYNKKFENREKWEKPNLKKILSFIPGTIFKVNVKPGQSIRKGQVMFVLEAMKMKNKVIAPFAGKIKAVNVKNGQNVPKNYVIIEFE